MSARPCTDGRGQFPAASLEQFRGKWVAFAADGSKVLASGDSELDLARNAEALGLTPGDYVIEPVPAHDTVIL